MRYTRYRNEGVQGGRGFTKKRDGVWAGFIFRVVRAACAKAPGLVRGIRGIPNSSMWLELQVMSGGERWGDWPRRKAEEEVLGQMRAGLTSWSSTSGGELGKRIKLAWKNQICISKTQLSRW